MHIKIAAAAIFALVLVVPASGSTYTVNNLGDAADATAGDNICDAGGGVCTLRAAIEEANAHAGTDTIAFSVAGLISPAPYSALGETVIIDGTTAPGYAGVPVVHIDGGGTNAIGLWFLPAAASSVLTALEISGYFGSGILLNGSGITVQRCYIGPITQGNPNGIGIEVDGSNVLIGGNDGFGNVISGNNDDGIEVKGSSATISDNFIGTNAAGTAAFGNGGQGVDVLTTSNTQIISTSANGQNVISGNTGGGISIYLSQNVTVAGNFIGTNATGTAAIANFGGVTISDSTNTTVGTSTGRNVISGNTFDGLFASGDSPGTVIDNNYIGTDVTGTVALPNDNGIEFSTSTVTIGTPAAGNLISGNTLDGIFIGSGAGGTPANVFTIANNIIGLDAAGVNIIGNGNDGVDLCCTTMSGTIGGSGANEGNVISGNGFRGIYVHAASNVTIQGNVIGLRKDGSDARGNLDGIVVDGGTGIAIGGAAAGARNLISGNSIDGVIVQGSSVGNTISGNYIGTDVTGMIDLGNLNDGLDIFNVPAANTITGNVISGNDAGGVRFDFVQAQTFTANLIGRNAANSASIPNGGYGINVEGPSLNNVFSGNTIASSALAGLRGALNTDSNDFAGNSFFSNGGLGIDLDPAGVNANDAQDPDTGANSRQNFPVISYATQLQIGGTINSNPNTALTIHLYSNTAADPSGFGEGETHLIGAAPVVTDAGGNASFVVFYGSPIPLGRIITGTANGPHGTSEFSQANIVVVAPPVLQFSSATYNVAEGAGSALITVTRTGETSSLVTVQYSTSPGTASPSADYIAVTGTLSFGAGVTSQTFSVPITADNIDEPNETLTLNLSNPGSATLGLSSATLTISDDDPTPSITIDDNTQAEGSSGTSNMTFLVHLSNPSASTITVAFTTAPGTATPGLDYTTTSGTLTFNPGVTTQQINVPIIGDSAMEGDETFFVNLSNASAGATIGDNQAVGTIANDDVVAIPTLSEAMLALLAILLGLAAMTRWKA